MNAPRDPETILAAWLDEGPTVLPDQTRRAIAVTTRTTEQGRRFASPRWRMPLRSPVVAAAVAAIIVVGLIAGALRVLTPDRGIGGPSLPPPSATPSATSVAWTTFHSTRFGYSIEYPTDWVATPATEDWPAQGFPYPDSQSVDRFGSTRTSTTWVFVSSVAMAPGQVAAERIAELDGDNALACQLSPEHAFAVGGVTGRQQDWFCFAKDYGIEVIATVGGRFYIIDLISSAPIDESLRTTFGRFLASVAFGGP